MTEKSIYNFGFPEFVYGTVFLFQVFIFSPFILLYCDLNFWPSLLLHRSQPFLSLRWSYHCLWWPLYFGSDLLFLYAAIDQDDFRLSGRSEPIGQLRANRNKSLLELVLSLVGSWLFRWLHVTLPPLHSIIINGNKRDCSPPILFKIPHLCKVITSVIIGLSSWCSQRYSSLSTRSNNKGSNKNSSISLYLFSSFS